MSKTLAPAPQLLKGLRELSKEERVECVLALCELVEEFGRPHVHSGLGIRKLGDNLFECRAGLSRRFLFREHPDEIFVFFLGTHDEIKTLLRSGRYR
ncbi:MAG TPA: hypothetical protein VMV72_01055 [Verrucomicrobiae bacterium]|nr:hypothetical protein [Verrucomicrobiae bacterium]